MSRADHYDMYRKEFERCTRLNMVIDRLAAENKDLRDYERKLEANEVVSAYQEKMKQLQADLKAKDEEIARWKSCNGSYDLEMLRQALYKEKCKKSFKSYDI